MKSGENDWMCDKFYSAFLRRNIFKISYTLCVYVKHDNILYSQTY